MARLVTVQKKGTLARVGDKWSLAWEAHYAKYGTQEGAREYADKVAGKRNPKTYWELSETPEGEKVYYEAFQKYLDDNPETSKYSGVRRIQDASKYSTRRFNAWAKKMGGIKNPSSSGNPFMSELISGVGTGTGLAISAALAGPLLIKRMKGAARELGLVKRGNPTDYFDRRKDADQFARAARKLGFSAVIEAYKSGGYDVYKKKTKYTVVHDLTGGFSLVLSAQLGLLGSRRVDWEWIKVQYPSEYKAVKELGLTKKRGSV